MRSRVLAVIMCVCVIATFAGCDKSKDTNDSDKENSVVESEKSTEEAVKLDDVSQMEGFAVEYTASDEIPDWKSEHTKIVLNDTEVIVDGKGAAFKNKTITINKGGYYVLSGKLSDGKIVIEADTKAKINLIFNGVDITCSDDAVINEKQADKVIITLVDNTENVLNDGEEHLDKKLTAAVYCKDSLTINGEGKLVVNGNNNDAITSKDKLKIIGSHVSIASVDDGIVGKDLVALKSANLDIESTGDGIKSSNITNVKKGIVCIDSGSISINSELDAIQAENFVKINGGELKITTGGGSVNDSTSKTDENGEILWDNSKMGGKRRPEENRPNREKRQGNWGHWGAMNENKSSDKDTPSAKAIKGGNGIYIIDGTINIDSLDDAIHANDMVYILGGTINISSGDDAIHADTTLDMSGGTIDIKKSYEGLEAYYINISGGEITLISDDDGINAAGGADNSSINGRPGQNMFSDSDGEAEITISGGNIRLTAYGDGIDSNGSITMTGGTVVISGPENGGNGSIDYENEFKMDAGVLLAAGPVGMFMSVGENSKQNVININISGNSNDVIKVIDEDKTIAEFTARTKYSAVIISVPELEEGKEYKIQYGDKETVAQAEKGRHYNGL